MKKYDIYLSIFKYIGCLIIKLTRHLPMTWNVEYTFDIHIKLNYWMSKNIIRSNYSNVINVCQIGNKISLKIYSYSTKNISVWKIINRSWYYFSWQFHKKNSGNMKMSRTPRKRWERTKVQMFFSKSNQKNVNFYIIYFWSPCILLLL